MNPKKELLWGLWVAVEGLRGKLSTMQALYKDPAYEAASCRSIVDPKRNAKVNNHRERVSYKQNLVRAAGDCHVERAGPFQP